MSTSKRKGDAWERAVVDVLRRAGHVHVERGYRLGAHSDRGDVDGIVGFLIECKDCARFELGVWMDEAVREAQECERVPVLVVKRRRADPARAYVVIELGTFARMLHEAELA